MSVRRLDQGEAVTDAEGVPEALQLAARVLEEPSICRPSSGLGAVFRAVDELRPDLGLVHATSASVAIAISASGAFSKFETTVLMTQDELITALKKAQDVAYVAPGAGVHV